MYALRDCSLPIELVFKIVDEVGHDSFDDPRDLACVALACKCLRDYLKPALSKQRKDLGIDTLYDALKELVAGHSKCIETYYDIVFKSTGEYDNRLESHVLRVFVSKCGRIEGLCVYCGDRDGYMKDVLYQNDTCNSCIDKNIRRWVRDQMMYFRDTRYRPVVQYDKILLRRGCVSDKTSRVVATFVNGDSHIGGRARRIYGFLLEAMRDS